MVIFFFGAAALLAGGAAIWVLIAYKRAGAPRRAAPAFAVAGLASLAAFGLYLALGRPDLADQPYAARIEALKHRDVTKGVTYEEALAILDHAARERPRDPEPLIYAGQVLSELNDHRQAARRYDEALARDPNSVAATLGLARALVRIEEGRVSPQARALFERASAMTPDDPVPFLYRALAAGQEGDEAGARALWAETLKRLPPDDPRRAMAAQMVRGGAGVNVAAPQR